MIQAAIPFKTMKLLTILLPVFFLIGLNTWAVDPHPSMAKLSHQLRPYVGGYGISPQAASGLLAKDRPLPIYVRLHTEEESALVELEGVGFQAKAFYAGLAFGFIDPSRLLGLASLDIVSTVFPYTPPMSLAVRGQGTRSLRADVVHEVNGYNGAGVKVGVISNSFNYFAETNPTAINEGTAEVPAYKLVELPDPDNDGVPELTGSDSQLSGDLPAVVEILKEPDPFMAPYPPRDPSGQPTDISDLAYNDEARALAEIVYDLAPGAEIAYHEGTTVPGMAQGILDLAEAGCQVIIDDQFFSGQPIYQDDEITKAIQTVAEQHDVVYITAAGNSGDLSVESAYHDAVPDQDDPAELPVEPLPHLGGFELEIPQKNNLHNWDIILRSPQPDPYLDITLAPQAGVSILLYWENPFSGTLGPGATTDYDFYVLNEPDLRSDTILQGSLNTQGEPGNPMGDPVEVLNNFGNSSSEPQTYYIALNLKQGPPANFKLIFVHNPRVDVKIQGDVRSQDHFMQIGHQKAEKALTIGAVNYVEANTQGLALGNPRTIEPTYYSSRGGYIPILYDGDGNALAEPELRFKPNLCSVDGVNTSFFTGSGGDYGFDEDALPNFLGTSCAAPHAAGLAALMRQANPELNAEQIRRWAMLAATDIGEPGVDSGSGWGLLYADDAVNSVLLGPPPSDSLIEGWQGY